MRRFVFFVFILIFSACCYAASKDVSLKNDAPSHSVIFGNALLTDSRVTPKNIYFQGSYLFDSPMFSAGGGMQAGSDRFDFYAAGVFWFLRTKHNKLGAGLHYHVGTLQDISTTNDLLAGLYYKFQPWYWFSVFLNFSYFFKARTVYAVADVIPVLPHNSLAASIRLDFYPVKYVSFFLEMSTYEEFRYLVFCAPSFIAGVSANFSEHISLWVSAKARYVDFFTLSAGYENTEFVFGARYSF